MTNFLMNFQLTEFSHRLSMKIYPVCKFNSGIKALVALAFSGSIGLLFLFLACALPQFNNWYPFTVVIFYLLSPIPTLIAKRHSEDSSSNPCRELAWFLTTGIVISAFALPIVLARAPVTVVTPDTDHTSTPAPTDLDKGLGLGNTTTTTTVIEGGAWATPPSPLPW